METYQFSAVAWTPWVNFDDLDAGTSSTGEEIGWIERRDGLAVSWLLDHARRDATEVVLRVESHARNYETGVFGEVAKRGVIVTNRGRRPPSTAATLVPMAYERELGAAMGIANHTALIATEHPARPLLGWAMATGATNLRTLRPTADTRTAEQREAVETLASLLYNGWRSSPGKHAAVTTILDLAESGMSHSVFVGSLLALAPHRVDRDVINRLAPDSWRQELEQIHRRCISRIA